MYTLPQHLIDALTARATLNTIRQSFPNTTYLCTPSLTIDYYRLQRIECGKEFTAIQLAEYAIMENRPIDIDENGNFFIK